MKIIKLSLFYFSFLLILPGKTFIGCSIFYFNQSLAKLLRNYAGLVVSRLMNPYSERKTALSCNL